MNEIARIEHRHPSLQPQNFVELERFAERASQSTLVPKDYIGKPENIILAVMMGAELGLAPMQALQNIAVVNGRPSIFGDAMPALCRQSAVCDDIIETIEGDGDRMVAICVAKRVGKKPVEQRFSVDDAKKAGLWGKSGPWSQYPQRMLQMRARGFALRDAFPDVLRGLISTEEAADIPAPAFAGTTIDGNPEPPAPTSRRDEINAETPMRPAAAAASVARAPRRTAPVPPADPLDLPLGYDWLVALKKALDGTSSTDDVTAIGGHERVNDALSRADTPPKIKQQITEMLADAYAKHAEADAADAAGEPELEPVEIAGAKYAAGD